MIKDFLAEWKRIKPVAEGYYKAKNQLWFSRTTNPLKKRIEDFLRVCESVEEAERVKKLLRHIERMKMNIAWGGKQLREVDGEERRSKGRPKEKVDVCREADTSRRETQPHRDTETHQEAEGVSQRNCNGQTVEVIRDVTSNSGGLENSSASPMSKIPTTSSKNFQENSKNFLLDIPNDSCYTLPEIPDSFALDDFLERGDDQDDDNRNDQQWGRRSDEADDTQGQEFTDDESNDYEEEQQFTLVEQLENLLKEVQG